MKAIHGFHPSGVLCTSNFAPGGIVDKRRRRAERPQAGMITVALSVTLGLLLLVVVYEYEMSQ
jgi:hypothetical protein